MRFQIRKKAWTLEYRDCDGDDGECCSPPDKSIGINPRIRGKRELTTIIHELLHAMYPSWSERKVETPSETMADVLWRLGWRPSNKEKEE